MATQVIFLGECASTNSAIDRNAPHGTAVAAVSQSAGRGQRGSSWESEPGMNVTMSVMLRHGDDGLDIERHFEISRHVALAVATVLDRNGIEGAMVKWPNDIYVGNRKICGILIENSLSGRRVMRSIAGVGLNVNQTEFHSDAPNPVSMKQLTGLTYDVEQLTRQLAEAIAAPIDPTEATAYRTRLWRGSGEHPWLTATGEVFTGTIDDVRPDGHIVIGGRAFDFKEVWPADLRDPSRAREEKVGDDVAGFGTVHQLFAECE